MTDAIKSVPTIVKSDEEVAVKAPSKAKVKFDAVRQHPATRRIVRNTGRAGVIGLGYTLMDEGINRTSSRDQNPMVLLPKRNKV